MSVDTASLRFVALTSLVAGLVGVGGCRAEKNLVTVEGPVPTRILQVNASGGEVLWRIDAPRLVNVTSVYYGVVPEKFAQVFPRPGTAPRPLKFGEEVAIVIVSSRYIYRHEGAAAYDNGFNGGFGETAPLTTESLNRALKGMPITDQIQVAPTVGR